MFYPNDQNNKYNLPVHTRWMIRRDMAEVQDIEESSFEYPWSEDDFIRCIRQRNCIGMIAQVNDMYRDDNEHVAGFMIYEFHRKKLHILNFAVAERFRRNGIGTNMLENLKRKLSEQRRNKIELEIRETNLLAQLFFRDRGFRAISILRDFYIDSPEDAYLMQYRLRSTKEYSSEKERNKKIDSLALFNNRFSYRNAF